MMVTVPCSMAVMFFFSRGEHVSAQIVPSSWL